MKKVVPLALAFLLILFLLQRCPQTLGSAGLPMTVTFLLAVAAALIFLIVRFT